eukprot:5847909-Prymnesium_polylepis.1
MAQKPAKLGRFLGQQTMALACQALVVFGSRLGIRSRSMFQETDTTPYLQHPAGGGVALRSKRPWKASRMPGAPPTCPSSSSCPKKIRGARASSSSPH